MIKDLFQIKKVTLTNAPKLYPSGIDASIFQGVNAIVGGTGLGKTTLVNSILFGLFGELGRSSSRNIRKVDLKYFKGRLTDRKDDSEPRPNPLVQVEAIISGKSVAITRNLNTGKVLKFTVEGKETKVTNLDEQLAKLFGKTDFVNEILRVIDHLLYVSENRYLLAWDNLLQSEVMALLFSDNTIFEKMHVLWERAQSADSEFRNLRHQAGRLEAALKELQAHSQKFTKSQIAEKRFELESARKQLESERGALQGRLDEASRRLDTTRRENSKLEREYLTYAHRIAAEENDGEELLFQDVIKSGNQRAIYWMIRSFVAAPENKSCPCCGIKRGQHLPTELRIRTRAAKDNDCPICLSPVGKSAKSPAPQNAADTLMLKQAGELRKVLQQGILAEERSHTYLTSTRREIATIQDRLMKARDAEWQFNIDHPAQGESEYSGRISAVKALRDSQEKAEKQRDILLSQFTKLRGEASKTFLALEKEIGERFAHYAKLFLDEECQVHFDAEGQFARRQGIPLPAPHSAFFPVIDGIPRPSPEALSEAQRLFIDLAFRMALIDVWNKKTGGKVTLIIETPEGTVDVAYMVRVAEMLRDFAKKGHTLLITTNLNNDDFLPELFTEVAKDSRDKRIINLLELGCPKPIQRSPQAQKKYDHILKKTFA